jgi:hypothetical protein
VCIHVHLHKHIMCVLCVVCCGYARNDAPLYIRKKNGNIKDT